LGETAKYLYLLFEDNHPLNLMDAPVVFTTEGHPMIVPSRLRRTNAFKSPKATKTQKSAEQQPVASEAKCPAFKGSRPLVGSSIVDRPDFFHAAAMAQLHLVPVEAQRSSSLHEAAIDSPGISMEDIRSPTNYTYYPWTLPQNLVPSHGYSAEISSPILSTLTFPNLNSGKVGEDKGLLPLGALQKVMDGVVISSLSNMRLSMVQEPRSLLLPDGQGVMVEMEVGQQYRVHGIANWPLGKDEKVLLAKEAMDGVAPGDPNFRRMKDLEFIDLVIDYRPSPSAVTPATSPDQSSGNGGTIPDEFEVELPENGTLESIWDEIETMFTKLFSGEPAPLHPAITPKTKTTSDRPALSRTTIPAILPTGAGAASLPAQLDTLDPSTLATGSLPNNKLYYLDSTLCSHRLPIAVVKSHQILVIRRGECSFNEKLANIPAFTPGREGLQLVVVVSTPESGSGNGGEHLIRPLLDERQKTPAGIERRHAIAMTMVEGSQDVVAALRGAAGVFARVDGDGLLREEEVGGDVVADGSSKASTTTTSTTTTTTMMLPGLGVKRRYWFESMGVPIGNLIVL